MSPKEDEEGYISLVEGGVGLLLESSLLEGWKEFLPTDKSKLFCVRYTNFFFLKIVE